LLRFTIRLILELNRDKSIGWLLELQMMWYSIPELNSEIPELHRGFSLLFNMKMTDNFCPFS